MENQMEEDLEVTEAPSDFGPGPGLTPSSAEGCSSLLKRARKAREAVPELPGPEGPTDLAD